MEPSSRPSIISKPRAASDRAAAAAADTSGGLIALGAELEGVFDRLARHHPDPPEPHELARALAMGSNHVTMILDGLQDRGLVVRGPHPHDRRRRQVRATDDGRALADAIGRQVRGLEARLMDAALTPQERARLDELAARARRVPGEIVVHETRARPGP